MAAKTIHIWETVKRTNDSTDFYNFLRFRQKKKKKIRAWRKNEARIVPALLDQRRRSVIRWKVGRAERTPKGSTRSLRSVQAPSNPSIELQAGALLILHGLRIFFIEDKKIE
jgi:hypothetical protein